MPTTPALFIGKATHFGLEVFYRHQQLGVTLDTENVTKKLLESWGRLVDEEDATFASVAEEQAFQKQVCDLLAAYLAFAPQFERPLAVEAAIEAPLIDPRTGEDLGVPLLGVLDLVLDYEAGPLICDFKTSGRSSEPIEILHEIQLSSYAYLFRQGSQWPESGLESGVGRGFAPRPQPQTGRASFQASGFPDDSKHMIPSHAYACDTSDRASGCYPSY
jgi:hypothetical protein